MRRGTLERAPCLTPPNKRRGALVALCKGPKTHSLQLGRPGAGTLNAPMRTSLGYSLMLAGGAVLLAGIYVGFAALANFYNDSVVNPLGRADGAEANTSASMLSGVVLGAVGIPPFLAGVVIVRRSRVRIARGQSLRKNW